MPGKMDRDHPLAAYMTPYASYRTGLTAADAAGVPAVADIDLSTSIDAVNNLIYVTGIRSAGAGALTVELWQTCAGTNSLSGLWRKVDEATIADTLDEVRFDTVYAAKYRLRIATIADGATWALHISYNKDSN